MLLILFWLFGLLSFFLLPYIVCLVVFILKRLRTLFLKPPTSFAIGSGIYLINKSYEIFLIDLIFSFVLFKLIHIIYRHDNLFKNKSSISLLSFSSLTFSSLSFSSVKSFSNSERIFKISLKSVVSHIVYIFSLNIFVFISWIFHPYILKKEIEIFWKQNSSDFMRFELFSSDF